MSILHSSARPSGASRREALLSARRGPVVHRATRHKAAYLTSLAVIITNYNILCITISLELGHSRLVRLQVTKSSCPN